MVYVVGDKPLNFQFQWYVAAMWPNLKPVKILAHSDGYFIMRLKSEEDCLRVLDNGPYFMNRKVVIVKRWSIGFDFREQVLRKLPIWFRLPKLPLGLLGR